jgi:hypothetical protein
MEIFLNLAWAMLALSSVCLWVRFGRRTGMDRRIPVIALLMLIVVLFPVISVSDDLWSLQNPAETNAFQRRDQLNPSPHSVLPQHASLCEPHFSGLDLAIGHIEALANPPVPTPESSPITGIQNRPPPTV